MSFSDQDIALAQPQGIDESKLEAWYMDDSEEDQRLPHKQDPNKPCSMEEIGRLGILSWKLEADKYENDPKLDAIRKVRGYNYHDVITVSPDKLPDYDGKLKMFFEEHMHEDEEIRYVLEGSGYFDVRDKQDKWIRIKCGAGDAIALPEGIYHRFTLDSGNYIKAMRLFSGVPEWTPYYRPQEQHQSRIKYINQTLPTFA